MVEDLPIPVYAGLSRGIRRGQPGTPQEPGQPGYYSIPGILSWTLQYFVFN